MHSYAILPYEAPTPNFHLLKRLLGLKRGAGGLKGMQNTSAGIGNEIHFHFALREDYSKLVN